MKKILLLSLFALSLTACQGGGGDGGGGGGSPSPAAVCNDPVAVRNANGQLGYPVPCVCPVGGPIDYSSSVTDSDGGRTCKVVPPNGGGGGGGGGGGQAPATIFFSSNPVSYFVGVPIITEVPPSVQNCGSSSPCTWSVAPALPSGLSINVNTGAIKGLPNNVTAARNYVITATNSNGSANTSLNLGVIHRPPSGLSITSPSSLLPTGSPISVIPVSYTSEDGSITSMTISPALPAGLVFNTYSTRQWAISGTPTEQRASQSYTITAIGPQGQAQVNVTLGTVTLIPPSGLSFSEVHPFCSVISGIYTCDIPQNTPFSTISSTLAQGTNITYSISLRNGQPHPDNNFFSGMSLTSEGKIATTSFGVFESSAALCGGAANFCTFTIKAENAYGSTTPDVKIRVYAAAPSLSYEASSYVLRILRPVPSNMRAISTNISCQNTAGCYTISPALPAGVSMSSLNGTISGSPNSTSFLAPTVFTITANHNTGSLSTQITIEVKERIPAVLTYIQGADYRFVKNRQLSGTNPMADKDRIPGTCTTFDNISPDNPPVPITSFSVSPALPAGLILNTGAFTCTPSDPVINGGVISGTPTVYSPKTNYTISACNSGGCSQTVIAIEISPEILQVVSGEKHSCALISEIPTGGSGSDAVTKVACWGDNSLGQLGITSGPDTCGVSNCAKTPQVVNISGAASFPIDGISAGKNHTCVTQAVASITQDPQRTNPNRKILCWGDNSFGQIGQNSVGGFYNTPVAMTKSSGAVTIADANSQISSGGNASCYINAANSGSDEGSFVYCVGENYGSSAIQVGGNADPLKILYATQVVVGKDHACSIMVDVLGVDQFAVNGKVVCWGKSNNNQFGNNTNSSTFTLPSHPYSPVKLNSSTNILNVKTLTSGQNFSCGLQNNSTVSGDVSQTGVFCWGDNSFGQHGVSSVGSSIYAVQMKGLSGTGNITNVRALGSTANSVMVISEISQTEHKLYMSGQYALAGSPYVGSSSNVLTPIKKTASLDFSPISSTVSSSPASTGNACAIDNKNALACWGSNDKGQLGNNSIIDSILPVYSIFNIN